MISLSVGELIFDLFLRPIIIKKTLNYQGFFRYLRSGSCFLIIKLS